MKMNKKNIILNEEENIIFDYNINFTVLVKL